MDPRIDKLATLLVNHSLGVRPGWLVSVEGPAAASPLLLAVYREVLAAGGHPRIQVGLEESLPLLLENGTAEQISHLSSADMHLVEEFDARVRVLGSGNTRLLSGVDKGRFANYRKAHQPLLERTMERTADGDFHWVGTLYPTAAHAQEAGMSLADYEEFVWGAGHLHLDDPAAYWRDLSKAHEVLVERLSRATEMRVIAPDTDLRMSVAGRTWIGCAGELNFPDGEVFTAPVEGSVEGEIRYRTPTLYNGVLVRDIRLRFEGGRVTEASAAEGEDHLHALIDMDEGARVPGEIAIGTNYGIQRHTLNILFDEKIGGTVHMALGAGYPESGSTNKSALHWDMICDLRQGGEIQLDGETVSRDGRFTLPGLELPGT